jgi:hypothetical protein
LKPRRDQRDRSVGGGRIWLSAATRSQNDWVRHTLEVRNQIAQILSLVQSAETGQHGYLLTTRLLIVACGDRARQGTLGEQLARFRHMSIGSANPTARTRKHEVGIMLHRRRDKQTISPKERLTAFAKEAREKASMLPPGDERRDLLKQARQADTASHIDDWANSPGLQPPK